MRGRIAVVLASFFWGSSFVVIKGGYSFVDPFYFLVLRFLTASLFLGLGFLIFGKRVSTKIFKNKYILLLAIFNAAAFIFQYSGLIFTTASKASLLINFNVVFVAIFSSMFLKERITGRKGIAIALGLFGIFLLTTEGDFSKIKIGNFFGDFLVFFSGLMFACYIVVSKKAILEDLSPQEITFSVIIYTTIILSPVAFFGKNFYIDLIGIFVILYTGLFVTVIALFLYTYGLKEISATESGIILLLEIFFAILLAFLFLGEVLTKIELVGGIFVLTAVFLVGKS